MENMDTKWYQHQTLHVFSSFWKTSGFIISKGALDRPVQHQQQGIPAGDDLWHCAYRGWSPSWRISIESYVYIYMCVCVIHGYINILIILIIGYIMIEYWSIYWSNMDQILMKIRPRIQLGGWQSLMGKSNMVRVGFHLYSLLGIPSDMKTPELAYSQGISSLLKKRGGKLYR